MNEIFGTMLYFSGFQALCQGNSPDGRPRQTDAGGAKSSKTNPAHKY